MGDLGFEPRTSGLRVRCATVALVTRKAQWSAEMKQFCLPQYN
jgi:hypothetical protein